MNLKAEETGFPTYYVCKVSIVLKFAAKPLDSLPPCHGIGYAYVAIKRKN